MAQANKIPLFTSNKDVIAKSIGAIGRASTKLNRDIQSVAVNCVMHAVEHGNVTLADNLLDACGKGIRRDSLRAWFELHGCMVVSSVTKKFTLDAARRDTMKKLPQAELAATLLALPWDEAKREPVAISVIDIDEQFDKFMARMGKMIKEADVTVKNRDLLERLNTLSATYHAEKVMGQRSPEAAAAIEAAEAAK